MDTNLHKESESRMTREERVAAALRENLRRRKQQAENRARANDKNKEHD